jgi:hypothetical protein
VLATLVVVAPIIFNRSCNAKLRSTKVLEHGFDAVGVSSFSVLHVRVIYPPRDGEPDSHDSLGKTVHHKDGAAQITHKGSTSPMPLHKNKVGIFVRMF